MCVRLFVCLCVSEDYITPHINLLTLVYQCSVGGLRNAVSLGERALEAAK